MAFSNEAQKILTAIARRKGVSKENWHSRSYVWTGPDITPYNYKCFLCGEEWKEYGHEILYDHGIQHLKEYNLLPFI